MARENTVFLYGWIGSYGVEFKINPETGQIYLAQFTIETKRRDRMNSEMYFDKSGKILTDAVCVRTKNPVLIKKLQDMMELKTEDHDDDEDRNHMIFVKGTLVTAEKDAKVKCPYCQGINTVHEEPTVVDPISIDVLEKDVTKKEAYSLMDERIEWGNLIYIEGIVCSPPTVPENAETKPNCKFRLASTRIRRIKEDGDDKKTDFPLVRTYAPGLIKDCMDSLRVGSSILVSGGLSVRPADERFLCEFCSNPIKRKMTRIDISPYHIEWHRNCVPPAAAEEEENAILKEAENYADSYTDTEEENRRAVLSHLNLRNKEKSYNDGDYDYEELPDIDEDSEDILDEFSNYYNT